MVPTTYGPAGGCPRRTCEVAGRPWLGDGRAERREPNLDGLHDALAVLVRLLVGKQHLQVRQVGRLLDVPDDAVPAELVVARERRLRPVRLDAGVVRQRTHGAELVHRDLDGPLRRTAILGVDVRVLHLLDRLAAEALQEPGDAV